ncbi:MAG: GNAT family N-acetyltransferase [Acidobacteria bacterium]|nr:GNAT family N-acetyltransferase [Acidobacteriota bacterium]
MKNLTTAYFMSKPNFEIMLETERLSIRKFTPDDLGALVEMRSSDEVIKYLGGKRLQNPAALKKRLRFYIDCYEKYGYGMCAMQWKATGEMCGWSGLQPLEDTGATEIGYGLTEKYWRKGLGFECAGAWLEYGFNVVNLEKIVAVAQPENTASWHIMEKLGMTYTKTERHYDLECVFYAVTRDEFFKQVNSGNSD